MATIDDLLGSPDFLRQLIGEEQFARSKEQALNQGILQASLAALGGRGNAGQVLSQAGTAGLQGYQGAFDRTLSDMAKGMQMQEIIRKQKEAQQIKDVLASAARPVYETVPPSPNYQGEDYAMGGQKLTGMTYDMKSVIPTLQALGRFDLIKDIGESQKSIRQSGIMGDANAPSPFAPYLQATNPAVRQLATQLQSGFERGIIDEETAYKRIEPLAKMEESYVAKSEKAAEGKKPTEGEKNAAGFAQTMEFAEANLNKITNQVAKEKLAGKNVGEPYETARTQFLGGIPLAGDYLKNVGSSKQQNLYRQAQENWVRAKLRKESGAAIGKDEMEKEISTFFPTAGESNNPEIVAQKAMARKVAIESMKKAAGNAYEPFDMRKFMRDNGLEGR